MIAAALAALAVLLHAATVWRYGYFRDELYFIACSKHLAWGYVDQPPLVAVAAWLAGAFGYNLAALRVLPIAAAALTVYVAVLIAREAGGGRFAQMLAGIATLLMPAYLALGNTLTTSSFEPLTWTLLCYIVVRMVRAAPSRAPVWWIAAGIVVAAGMYAKYSMLFAVIGLAIGLIATPQRRVFRSKFVPLAAALTFTLLLPNVLWQATHGWPFAEVLRGDAAHRPGLAAGYALEYDDRVANARAFTWEQLLYTNPVAAVIWVGGLVAPFRMRSLQNLRFVAVAYVAVFAIAVMLEAKGYYIVGFYAALLAIGAVAIERAALSLRATLFAALAAVGIVALPLSLPVLPIDGLIAYSQRLGLTGQAGTAPHLIEPLFAEEFGWVRLARDVGGAYASLPPSLRRRTAIYADTYGDAGALDFFGPRYGLPAAISSQNNYYLWGPRDYDGQALIAIGATRVDLLRRYYRSVILLRTSSEPYKWIVEGPSPIYLCTGPVAPLYIIWPRLRWYGA